MGDIIKQILARPIQLADQVIKLADEASSFKQDCLELKSKTSKLSDLLRQAARSSSELYERPASRIVVDTEQVLEKALSLVQKCQANGLLKRAFTIIPTAAFRKMFSQLENCVGDFSWLLRVSGAVGDDDVGYLGLPPIAANEPILGLIWEQIANVSMGPVDERPDAAASLVSMARDNDRYGKLIIEEGGVVPLSKLLKESKTVEGQESAARALGLLGRDPESVEHMVHAGVCSVFEKILKDGPMKVQAMVAWAVSEMAAHYPKCQDIFAQHHVIRLLVGHLAFETVQEHSKYAIPTKTASIHNMAVAGLAAMANAGGNMANAGGNRAGPADDDEQPQIGHPLRKQSLTSSGLHNVVTSVQAQAKAKTNPSQPQTNMNGNGNGNLNQLGNHSISSNGKLGSSHHHHNSLAGSKARERELEDPQVKASMKAMSARALWHLARGNSAICRNICESRALLCFAKLLEEGAEEVQYNSAMALMEITAVAEKDAELRRSTFKPNSPACKAVVDQLLKIIEKADSILLVPCVKAIGNLARTFKATETRMIGPLVLLLDEREDDVSREAAIALTKFAGSENYLRIDHSKAIIEAEGIKHLVQLVYLGEHMVQIPALVLLSYIGLNVPDSEELAKCEALTVLEWASKQSHLVQDESIEALLLETKSRLELYQSRVSR